MKSVILFCHLVIGSILDPTAKYNRKSSDKPEVESGIESNKCFSCFNLLPAADRRLLCGATGTQSDRSQIKLIQGIIHLLMTHHII